MLVGGMMVQEPLVLQDLLGRFIRTQHQRAETYSTLSLEFRNFLSSRNDGEYHKAMAQATAAFSSCSQQVREIEKNLREGRHCLDMADVLRAVQEQERDKLRLTLTLQSLKQAYAFKVFSWQTEDIDPLEPHAHRTCGCGSATAHGAQLLSGSGAPHHQEPTQVEYEQAVREAQLLLDGAVQAINDMIEEVRYFMEE